MIFSNPSVGFWIRLLEENIELFLEKLTRQDY